MTQDFEYLKIYIISHYIKVKSAQKNPVLLANYILVTDK